MEPSTSAYITLVKYVGAQTVIAALATVLGFLILRPASVSEALVRITFTVIASIVFGPLFVAAVHSHWPELFNSATYLAEIQGTQLGVLYVTAPLQILAGMPAWWVLGAFIRWFHARSNKDLGELWHDFIDYFPSSRNNDKKPRSDN